MPVLLPNTRLSVRKVARPLGRDPHGKPLGKSTAQVEPSPPKPGAVTVPFDGEFSENQWTLRLDPSEWPIGEGDLVDDLDNDRTLVIRYARLHAVPGFGYADYIRATADLDPPKER